MAKDTPEDMKLYDSEITGQLNTFLFAGSDTTAYVIHFPTLHDIDIRSGTIAWALHRLATNPDVQDRLRARMLELWRGSTFRADGHVTVSECGGHGDIADESIYSQHRES